MRKLLMAAVVLACVLVWFVAGCGGEEMATFDQSQNVVPVAEEGNPVMPSVSAIEEKELPPIVDFYEDHIFKYADPTLYGGEYRLLSRPADTCSDFLKTTSPLMTTVNPLLDGAILVDLYRKERRFAGISGASIGPYDVWGYVGAIEHNLCALVMGTKPQNDDTYDVVALVCMNNDRTEYCSQVSARIASNTYQVAATKSEEDPDMSTEAETLQEAAEGILERYEE